MTVRWRTGVNFDPAFHARPIKGTCLSPGQLETLGRLFVRRRYPSKATILPSGQRTDALFVVASGTVQLAIETEWGQTVVLRNVPGDVFGEDLLLGETSSPYLATAVDDTDLYVLDRSDLEELCARAPAILMDIMRSVARRLHSVSQSFQDQSRQQIDDQLANDTSLHARLADLVMTRGGSWQALLLFTIAICTWLYVGQCGLAILHIGPFDPAPFKMLNLILGILAAVVAPVILLVLNRNEEREPVDPRSRERLGESLQTVRNALDRNRRQMQDRLVSPAGIAQDETTATSQTLELAVDSAAIPHVGDAGGQF
jgi:uncharacterized membrane protein